nr:multidrug efflux SMR transporter [Acetobacter cerevisiae]
MVRSRVPGKPYLYLAVAIVAEVFATSCLTASHGFEKRLPGIISLLGYGVAFYFLSLPIKTIPVGVVYAIWSGVGIVLVSLIGATVFKQSLDLPALAGIALIMAGVLVINLFSKSV